MVRADLGRLRSLTGSKWGKHPGALPAWVADMDFDVAPAIKAAITARVERGEFGYDFTDLDRLVGCWADRQAARHGWSPDPDLGRLFTGTLHALDSMLLLHTEPGDGVAVFTPIYYPFRTTVAASGRRLVDVPLTGPDWRITPELLAESIDDGTRLILFCQPHNPLGRVFDRDELAAVAEVAERLDLVVISDEIWGDLVHGERAHLPLQLADPRFAGRTVTLGSASKTFSLAGLRSAVAHVDVESLRTTIDGLPAHTFGRPSSLSAAGAMAAWTRGDEWLRDAHAVIEANCHHVVERLGAVDGVQAYVPDATYLMWLDFAGGPLADQPARRLQDEHGLVLSDGAQFCPTTATSCARLNVATSREILDQMLDRIVHALDEGGRP